MLTLKYQPRTAEVSVKIASNSVNAIYSRHTSPLRQQIERYPSVLYITGALIPLICVIVNENEKSEIKLIAIQSFQKALFVLQDIAPGLAFARLTLQQLRKSVLAANKAIVGEWPQDNSRQQNDPRQANNVSGAYSMGGLDLGGPHISSDGDGLQVVHGDSFIANLTALTGNDQFLIGKTDAFDSLMWETHLPAL
jgi:hypothetical protein